MIYLIEAKVDYINIKTGDKNYAVHSTLKKIEEKISNYLLLEVHPSFIIYPKKNRYQRNFLIKKDAIPASRSKRVVLMKRLDLHCLSY